VFIKDDKKLPASQADGQSHKPAKHIEETARLASSIEATKERCDELKIKSTPHRIWLRFAERGAAYHASAAH
jgi:hypothetical protein